MDRSISQLAKQAMKACKEIEGFSATQEISAGPIKAQARLHFRRPEKISLEYRSYEDPLADFEEKLSGSEFIPSELTTMQIVYNDHQTWIIDSKRNVTIQKLGRRLYSPLRLPDGIADIEMMYHLTSDFLLRDEGKETINGRKARKMGLKPKVQQRISLFKDETFPLKKAAMSIDSETLFPLHIVLWPSPQSPLYYIVGPTEPITIDYKDILLDAPKNEVFQVNPPEQMRILVEQEVPASNIQEKVPFDIPVKLLEDRGYQLRDNMAFVTASEKGDRAYALLSFEEKERASNKPPSGISVRVGNYLSCDMNRRRALIATNGEEIGLSGKKARILDRNSLLKDEIPPSAKRSLFEVSWQQEEVYWFVLAEGIEKEDLVDIATAITNTQSKEKTSTDT